MTAPVNVLHVTTGMGLGGAETMLARLVAHSDPTRVTHHLLALSNEGALWKPASESSASALNLLLDRPVAALARLPRLRRFVLDAQPGVIHGWMYHGNLAASWIRGWVATGARLVFGIRQSLYDIGRERPLTRAVIRAGARRSRDADAIIYNSAISRDQHSAIGYRRDLGRVIPNGFDTRKFSPDPDARSRTRARLGLAAEEFVVGMVGRFHEVKDHATFLRAAAALAAEVGNARILVAGPGCTNDNPDLRALVARHAPAARVELLGAWPDTEHFYPALDALCLTSRAEGFPNVVGEAMSCGVPCVCTRVGEVPALLGDAGFLSEVGDADSIARHLQVIARLDPERRRAISTAARERIRDHYSIDDVMESYMNLYTAPVAVIQGK